MKTAKVTILQYGILIVGALIANGIFSLPRVVSQDAGKTAWVVIAFVGFIVFLLAALADRLASNYPEQDPAEWSLTLLGPVLGRIWLALYVVKSLFFAVLTAKIYGGIVTGRVLLQTPSSIIAAIIIILSVMAVLAKLGGLARFSEISVLVWLPMIVLIVATINRAQFFHLRPIFGDAGLSDLLSASKNAIYSFAGFDILLFAYPHLQKRKGSLRAVFWAFLFVTLVYVVTTIAATTFLGMEQMTRVLTPTLVILSITETSIIERFDSLALFVWIGIEVITAATQLYMGTRAIQGIIKGVSYHKAIMALGAFLLVATWGDTPLRDVVAISDTFGAFDMSFVAGSVVILLVLTHIKKVKQKNAPAA